MKESVKRKSVVYYLFGFIPIWIIKEYSDEISDKEIAK